MAGLKIQPTHEKPVPGRDYGRRSAALGALINGSSSGTDTAEGFGRAFSSPRRRPAAPSSVDERGVRPSPTAPGASLGRWRSAARGLDGAGGFPSFGAPGWFPAAVLRGARFS